jgi:HD superfamily phosphohydrolase
VPDWGLTPQTRQTKPYGLDPWWLEPGKVVTDPIHGDIFITRLEQILLDTPPVQRLRRVRQLGTTHLVYPGATHTRFSHSLGSVRVVQTLLDAVIGQRNRNHVTADLFAEWEQQAKTQAATQAGEDADVGAPDPNDDPPWLDLYRKQLAEMTVLARLGALLHDIGHVPFGHTIEDDLRLLTPHDQGEVRFVRLWEEILESLQAQLRLRAEREEREDSWIEKRRDGIGALELNGALAKDLRFLVLSSQKDPDTDMRIDPVKHIRYPFVADMVGNTICADLLDYLQRDHIFSGLPVSLGKRYLSSFYITPEAAGGIYPKRMALLIHRNGRVRLDIETEILKHLRYRYELQERVLVHHSKLAADAMVGKMFELWIEAKRAEFEKHPKRLERAAARIPADFDYPRAEGEKSSDLERAGRWELEELLLRYGDDGVLEHLQEQDGDGPRKDAAELAGALLSRTLYKPAASALGNAAAEDLHKEFGPKESRRELERLACKHAGIRKDWHLVLWIPDPDMRLKLAELLVNDGEGVAKFKDKSPRGSDIYDGHKDLWTISVFVHPSVPTEKVRNALAKLGQVLGVSWDSHGDALGGDPAVAPEHLAAVRLFKTAKLDGRMRKLIEDSKSADIAARGAGELNQEAIDNRLRVLAEQRGYLRPEAAT